MDAGKSKNLTGSTAYGGFVKGKVKVLMKPQQIRKIKEGDILVATNTTPEYVSAMKKSSAVLTEKGGITSHASIIARELKIPCIVGINNLTQILKDGDSVEVDANKGIIKILG